MGKKTEKANQAKRKNGGGREVADPEVLPKEDPGAAGILWHREDEPALVNLETSILRDIGMSGKLDKAGAMVAIKIGLALTTAKDMLRHGEFEPWVEARFGDVFSQRKARYFRGLAKAFLKSEEGKALMLPAPRDTGNWLVRAEDGSELGNAVGAFIGDQTIAELLDKHGVRPVKRKGGWRPPDWAVRRYQQEHQELKNKPFDTWADSDREAFRAWYEKEAEADDTVARREAAYGTWTTVRNTLADHGLGRKSWMLMDAEDLKDVRDVLAGVAAEMGRGLKGGGA